MSSKFRITSIFLILLFMLTFYLEIPVKALETASTPVTFADAGLEKVIREKLQKYTGTITVADMETIENIYLDNLSITNLSGLEYAVNLIQFTSFYNIIQDLSPISNLTKLEHLYLVGGSLNGKYLDTTFLEKLINLKTLGLINFSIKDITQVSRLVDLEYANFSDNYIEDITPLSGLRKLSEVCLNSNKIKDISCINKFISVKGLDLGGNELRDIRPLVEFAESGHAYGTLNILYNYLDISDGSEGTKLIKRLSNYCNTIYYNNQRIWFNDDKLRLKILEAFGYPMTTILTNNHLSGLTTLNLDDSDINDLAGLQYASNLTSLSLNNNKITSLVPLKSLKNLIELSAESNYIDDISALQNMTKLQYLNLNDNYIANIDSLNSLIDLEVLGLSANVVSDLNSLRALTMLQVLDLGYNVVSNITGISDLTNLIILSLESNSIADISPLINMKSLQIVNLQNNKISNISVLNTLKSFGAFSYDGSTIDLTYNYLDLSNSSQQAAYCTNLKVGGTTVIAEPQFSSLTPVVKLSNPSNDTSNFPINLPIMIQFDKPVVAGSNIDYISIVGENNKIIRVSVNINNDRVTISPNEKLDYGKKYIIQIPIGAFISKADNHDNDDFIAVFTTISGNPYDINKDGTVDIFDIASTARMYNVKSSDAKWIDTFDVNKDAIIDIYDLVIISRKFS